MNQRQTNILREMLADVRRHIDNLLRELDVGMTTDAGLVVVSRPYCMWMSVTDYGLFCEWDYRWMVADGWRYTGCRIVFAASGWMSHEVNISPSYLTIADARGEGEVGVDVTREWAVTHFSVCAGPAPQTMATGWWDPVLVQIEAYAWCRNWPLVASTVLDCAAVPYAMTWRAV